MSIIGIFKKIVMLEIHHKNSKFFTVSGNEPFLVQFSSRLKIKVLNRQNNDLVTEKNEKFMVRITFS